MLEGFSSTLNGTADSIGSLISNMDNNLIAFLKRIPNNPDIAKFITTYDTCKAELIADKNKILNVASRIKSIFSSSKEAADAADDLGEQIKRLNFNAIPDNSQIDLKNTGQRANGDQIKIRAILEKPAVAGAQPERKVIERRSFKVQQIGLYSRVRTPALIS